MLQHHDILAEMIRLLDVPFDAGNDTIEVLGDHACERCFLAGANSIFYGDKLLTTGNPEFDKDQALMAKLGLKSGKALTARVNAG